MLRIGILQKEAPNTKKGKYKASFTTDVEKKTKKSEQALCNDDL